jgi:hypothetical protein
MKWNEKQLITLTLCYDSFKFQHTTLKISLYWSDICRVKWHLHTTQRQQPITWWDRHWHMAKFKPSGDGIGTGMWQSPTHQVMGLALECGKVGPIRWWDWHWYVAKLNPSGDGIGIGMWQSWTHLVMGLVLARGKVGPIRWWDWHWYVAKFNPSGDGIGIGMWQSWTDQVMGLMNPVHTTPSYISKIHLNIILPPTSRSS